MANFEYSFDITDEGGSSRQVTGFIAAVDSAAVDLAVGELMVDIDDFTTGVISTNYSLVESRIATAPGLKTVAVAGGNVKKKAKFTFTDGNGHNKLQTIPTFDDINHGLPNDDVDITSTPVAAYVAHVLADGHATNRFEDLVSLVKAVESYG